MSKIKINKVKVGIIIAILFVFLLNLTGLSRYVTNTAKDAYFASKNFYFRSDILKSSSVGDYVEYTYQSWGGVSAYTFDIGMYSFKNDYLKMLSDLNYVVNITYEKYTNINGDVTNITSSGSSKIEYGININKNNPHDPDNSTTSAQTYSKERVIRTSNSNTDTLIFYISPLDGVLLSKGDTFTFLISATSVSPYAKNLYARVIVKISESGADYSIEDLETENYLLFHMKNSSTEEVTALFRINPVYVRIDNTNKIFDDDATIITNRVIDSIRYIDSASFKLAEETAIQIRLYKTNEYDDLVNDLKEDNPGVSQSTLESLILNQLITYIKFE